MTETLNTEYYSLKSPTSKKIRAIPNEIEYSIRPLDIYANQSDIFNLLTRMGSIGWNHYMTEKRNLETLFYFKRTVIMEEVKPEKAPRKPRAKKETANV